VSFITDLQTFLTANVGLTALISGRLYPNNAPADAALPFVIYYEFATPREQSLTGPIVVSKPRIQYSIYSQHYLDGLAVADALRAALLTSSYPLVFEDERANNDATSGIHRRDVDVRFNHLG
jgi:hypothetical protein